VTNHNASNVVLPDARVHGKTQEEVAKIVGVTQQAIAQWEKENTSNTTSCNASNVVFPDVRTKISKQWKFCAKSEKLTCVICYNVEKLKTLWNEVDFRNFFGNELSYNLPNSFLS